MTKKLISIEAAATYLEQLNLDYIIDAMCADSYALPRWNHIEAKHCANLYKNFLVLQKKHPTESLVPSRQIDEFWHNHILHTKNYMNDCLQIFGHYLHHHPASPNEEPQKLITNYLKTKQLYRDEFNSELTDSPTTLIA